MRNGAKCTNWGSMGHLGVTHSDLTLGYLDDLTLAGPQSVVAADIQQVMAEGSKMGLCLNPSKCEVISHPDPNIVDQTMSSFTFLSVADATLLGAPLFRGKILDDTWLARCGSETWIDFLCLVQLKLKYSPYSLELVSVCVLSRMAYS